MCDCYKYASDYRRIVRLAIAMANTQKKIYVVFQKEDQSYGFAEKGTEPENIGIQYTAIPVY